MKYLFDSVNNVPLKTMNGLAYDEINERIFVLPEDPDGTRIEITKNSYDLFNKKIKEFCDMDDWLKPSAPILKEINEELAKYGL